MTIAVQTSAVVAVLFAEPEPRSFAELIEDSDVAISAASVAETLRVLMVSRAVGALPSVRALMEASRLRIVGVAEPQLLCTGAPSRRVDPVESRRVAPDGRPASDRRWNPILPAEESSWPK